VCRDFTINALYYDPATNEVLDFVGGVEDAQSCTLRLTGDNVKRLTEDPLRVLRGVRFATVLGLKLAPGTALAMKQYAHMCSLNAGEGGGS
jgi:tRNA nucleotidyltransferase/poly(A) polymerase